VRVGDRKEVRKREKKKIKGEVRRNDIEDGGEREGCEIEERER
jgi:hypothetical protein